MAGRTGAKARARAPLSRERVLHAAIRLADEGGIESLSMRRLGQALGVEAMSLYNHVTNKDDILDGIVDLVVSEIELPSTGESWKAAIRQCAVSANDVFLRHHWACSLAMSPVRTLPSRLRYMEWLLGRFREAGFPAELTYHAYHAVDSHILGFTLWQVGHSAGPVDLEELASAFVRELSDGEFPYLAEHADQHLSGFGQDGEGEFAFVLDLLLDGLERARDAV